MNAEPLQARIVAEIVRDPKQSGATIASLCGCSEGHVSFVARKFDLTFGRQRPRTFPLAGDLDTENKHWVLIEATKLGLTPTEFINACVTDARLDDEEMRAA